MRPPFYKPVEGRDIVQSLKRIICAILVLMISLSLSVTSLAQDVISAPSVDIVFVIDVSGSMNQADSESFSWEAMQLGLDLAPQNSRVAIIAVNNDVVSQTGFTDVSAAESRRHLEEYISSLQNEGNTDFSPGIHRAVEMLETSSADEKRVIFLGDFQEGGHNISANSASKVIALLDGISTRARSRGIAIDMILWEDPPHYSTTYSSFLALPGATGGMLFELSNPNRAPASVEDIFFSSFVYHRTMFRVIGQDMQTFNIPMPTSEIRRVRVYTSAQNPASAFGAVYAGANVYGVQARSYSIVDVINPSPEGISVSVSPGAGGVTTVYTIFDYGPLALSVLVDNEEVRVGESQTSTIRTAIIDADTGRPILSEPYPDDAVFTIEMSSPSSQAPIIIDPTTPTTFTVSSELPEDFGTHTTTVQLSVGGLTFGPLTSPVEVADVRLPRPPINWPLIIAGALILIGLIIAWLIRRRNAVILGVVEMSSDYCFHGKLSVYGVILEGGEREIRPFDYRLQDIKVRRIDLRTILDRADARDAYIGAEGILILPGPEQSIIVRNNSRAVIKVMGQDYGHRSKVQLFFGQSFYLVFDKDENELKINYRMIKEDPKAVSYHFGSQQDQARETLKV